MQLETAALINISCMSRLLNIKCPFLLTLTCTVGRQKKNYQDLIAISIHSGSLGLNFTVPDMCLCTTKCFSLQNYAFLQQYNQFTGTTGDRERCPYVFMANSQSDMEEWVRTLRRVIGVPTSGGSVKPYIVYV